MYRGFEKLRRTFREPLRSGAVSLQTQSLSLSNPVQEAGSRESGLSCHAEGSRAHALAMQSSPVGSQDSSRSHSSVGAAADSLVLDSSALEEFKVSGYSLAFSYPVMPLPWYPFSCMQTAAKAVVQTQAPTTGIITNFSLIPRRSVIAITEHLGTNMYFCLCDCKLKLLISIVNSPSQNS